MQKRDIVIEITNETPEFCNKSCSVYRVGQIVQRTLDKIMKSIKDEGRIELRGFGTLYTKVRRVRKARNIRTGETIIVPQHNIIKFKQSSKVRV